MSDAESQQAAMKSSAPRRRVVLICGMFDMLNFGDLLFPLMAAHRLQAYDIEVVAVAPTARRPRFSDAMAPAALGELFLGHHPADGILIGGGYIIHHQRVDALAPYAGDGAVGLYAGPGLWLGATLAAAVRDMPVVWNAPGVPHPLQGPWHASSVGALRASDYVAVRDRGSLRLLNPPADVRVAVVPDTLAELASLWPPPTLTEAYREFLARKALPPAGAVFALHFRNRSLLGVDMAALAARIDAFAAQRQLTPVLLAVGEAHEDDVTAAELARHLQGPHRVLNDALSLREICAVLAHARCYVGASLHGYVAAAAYGVPAILVGKPAYRKFAGFLEHTARLQDLSADWPAAISLAEQRFAEPAGAGFPAKVFRELDAHWQAMVDAIGQPRQRTSERLDFLRSYLTTGVSQLGTPWLLAPIAQERRGVMLRSALERSKLLTPLGSAS